MHTWMDGCIVPCGCTAILQCVLYIWSTEYGVRSGNEESTVRMKYEGWRSSRCLPAWLLACLSILEYRTILREYGVILRYSILDTRYSIFNTEELNAEWQGRAGQGQATKKGQGTLNEPHPFSPGGDRFRNRWRLLQACGMLAWGGCCEMSDCLSSIDDDDATVGERGSGRHVTFATAQKERCDGDCPGSELV